jgi:hypothetical protein
MDEVVWSSPLAIVMYGLGALGLAAVLWILPIPHRTKRVAVGGLLVLAGLVPLSCGFCGLILVGFGPESLAIAGVVMVLGLAAVALGGRLLLAARRYNGDLADTTAEGAGVESAEQTD